MRAQYPKEMTIVLQHQFWGLDVTEEGFTVKLSFGGVRETLIIPFQSVISFADPSVKFGLQFETAADSDVDEAETDDADSENNSAAAPMRSPLKNKDLNDLPKDGQSAEVDAQKQGATKGADVVTLDAFRKK